MRLYTHVFLLAVIFHSSYAPPVSPEKTKEQDSEVVDDLAEYTEYHRYLKEVVQALESDPEFRERLEKADEEDVRSGKIAEQLDFVNHNVRTRLDEIKRQELERLRHLATKQYELSNNLEHEGKVPSSEHLDHSNPHTFEIEDLKKLIYKTTADLEAADKKRREQFKEYEMQKEYEKHQKMESLDDTHKKEYMEKLKQEEDAKKHHKPLHHPGSKQQLEEVWEKQDHMDQQFDPKAFFMTHDVDGNGFWDADEVKALFIKELDKMYGPGGPNKDLHERAEEMERMREHVFKENDKNHDGLIDFNEFMTETQRAEFNQDDGWKPIDENQIYTQAEYEAYEHRRQEELRYLQQQGLVDAQGRPIPGAQHQINQAYHQMQQQYHQQHPQGQPLNHGQYPPQYQGQMPQQGQFQAQGPQGQYQGQVPQYQGQIPQGQYQGQIPQGQYQGQLPQGQYQNQHHQGQYQGQASQGHISQGQAPVGQIPQSQGQQAQVPPQGQAQQQTQNQQQVSQGQVQQQVPQGQAQQQLPQGQVQQQISQGQIQQQAAQSQVLPVPLQDQAQGQQHPPQPKIPASYSTK